MQPESGRCNELSVHWRPSWIIIIDLFSDNFQCFQSLSHVSCTEMYIFCDYLIDPRCWQAKIAENWIIFGIFNFKGALWQHPDLWIHIFRNLHQMTQAVTVLCTTIISVRSWRFVSSKYQMTKLEYIVKLFKNNTIYSRQFTYCKITATDSQKKDNLVQNNASRPQMLTTWVKAI